MTIAGSPIYSIVLLAGILIGGLFWWFRYKKQPEILPVFIGGLCGAFIGAKLAFIFAELSTIWGTPDFWLRLAAGKSVVGGILGGFGGVEVVKSALGVRQSTGDTFALVLPFSLALGRVGCLAQGCCQGICMANGTRWPAAWVEAGFLLVLLGIIHTLNRQKILHQRLFCLFLVAYGTFRFCHEFLRETPKWFGVVSGYQVLCLLMVALGARQWHRRSRELRPIPN